MIKPWKKISNKTLFEHKRLTIYEDIVELPDGNRITYFWGAPSKYQSVSVIAVNEKGELLIQEQYNYPIGKALWELPGGSMKAGETPEQSAIRELAEETGHTADDVKIIGSYYTQNRFKDAKQYVVLCKKLRKQKLEADESEFIETAWVSIDRCYRMVADGDIQNINMLASLMLFKETL